MKWAAGIPAAIALALSAPNLGLGYFWDDYLFLTGGRAGGGPARFLAPEAGEAFYRPIAQGIYFLVLGFLDPSSGLLGHAVNLLALLSAIVVLVALVSGVSGRRAGMMAGLVLASSSAAPSLAAWVSCSQDLFAILLSLTALLLHHLRRRVFAIGCIAAAILCKETAALALPLLCSWDRIVGREPRVKIRSVMPYIAVGIVWFLFHPGLHALAMHGFASGATGYVGVEHPERWGTYLARYLMTLMNLPPVGFATPWPDQLSGVALLALVVVIVTVGAMPEAVHDSKRVRSPRSVRPIVTIALLLGLPTLLLPTILIRHWAPYFAAFPAVGFSMLAGAWLADRPKYLATVALTVFLLFGVWCRGMSARNEPVWSETVFRQASEAISTVRGNFHSAFPVIAPSSEVVLSAGATGVLGIRGTLVDNQALRVWYSDPTITTVSTLQRDPGAPAELLARVTSNLDVIAIDPATGMIRTASGSPPDWMLVGRTLRNYAREVAADGDTDGGIRAMDTLSKLEPPDVRPYNRRLVVMMLIAGGRRSEADSLLAVTPGFEPAVSLGFVERLLAEASSSEALDRAAFEAFGLNADDPSNLRFVVREMRREGSLAQAAWWAAKLAQAAPGDRDAARVIQEAELAHLVPARVVE